MTNPHDFHVPQSSYTRQELLKSSEGGYFGAGNAQLPAPPMLMMDRITEISLDGGSYGKGHVIGELDISPSLWFFNCHFAGDEMMPAVMRSAGLDRVGLRAMLAEVAGRLPLRPRSACSAEPDCQPSAA